MGKLKNSYLIVIFALLIFSLNDLGAEPFLEVPHPLSGDNPTYPLIPRGIPAIGQPLQDLHFGTTLTTVTQIEKIGDRTPLNSAQTLLRDFTLPIPLFAPSSAWNQKATQAAVLPENNRQILLLYRVLLGDNSSLHPSGFGSQNSWPFMHVSYDEYTIPVFLMGRGRQSVVLRDYLGNLGGTNPKLPIDQAGGSVTAPVPAGTIRPAGPENLDADGHLVLYNLDTFSEYDFWQATTARDAAGKSLGGGQPGDTILEAGAIDFFDVRGSGANPSTYSSARAMGTPLLAGLILPEDIY